MKAKVQRNFRLDWSSEQCGEPKRAMSCGFPILFRSSPQSDRGRYLQIMQRKYFFIASVIIALAATNAFADKSTTVTVKSLTGVWHHPFPGAGHWETLTFRKDGTFERVIRHRIGASRIAGSFTVTSDGNVLLAIKEHGLIDGTTSTDKLKDNHRRIRTHIAIKNGNDMILTNRDLPIPQYGIDNYYIYSRDYLREDEFNRRRKANIEEMLRMLDDTTDNSQASSDAYP